MRELVGMQLFWLQILILLVLGGCNRQPVGFQLELQEATSPENRAIKGLLQQADLSRVLVGLNAAFKLPATIPVIFREGPEQAVYQDGRIIICYDFLAHLDQALQEDFTDPRIRNEILLGEAHFVLYHEVGHALVQTLDIPVVGQEEDAVDGLATVIAVSVLKRPELAIGAAVALDALEQSDEDFHQEDYWDTHSLDAQRYYNIICWVHGGAPEMCEDLVAQLVPEDWFKTRAGDCPEEFERLRRNWARLLEPHFKPGIRLLARAKRKAKEREKTR